MSLTTQQALRSLLGAADREELRATFGDRVRFDEPLAAYTSWKIGGPADAFVTAATQAELADLMRLCLRRRLPWWIVGGGSNVLVGDGGMRGIVIRLAGDFAAVEVHLEGVNVIVEAGGSAGMALVTAKAASAGAAGIGSLAGIPGTIGKSAISSVRFGFSRRAVRSPTRWAYAICIAIRRWSATSSSRE